MTAGEDGWYSIEVPGWINSIIINANEGTIQTSDLSVEVGKDVWIVVTDPENAVVSYEEPAGEEAPPATEATEATTEAPETQPPTEEPAQENNNAVIVAAVVAAVVVLGVVVALVVKKKK